MRTKSYCDNCGNKIENPASQYQLYCDTCYKTMKGGKTMAVKTKAFSTSTTKKEEPAPVKSKKDDREAIANTIVAYMKTELKIPADELLKINHEVWKKLKI